MAPWNPNDPDALGPEFIPELTRSWTVGSTGGAETAVSQRFRSTAAESDPDLQVLASAVMGSGYILAEVLEDGDDEDFRLTDIVIDKIQPDSATDVLNFKNQAGSTVPANLIASIDETGDPSTSTDYIAPVTVGRRQDIHIQFDAAQIAAATAGRRILGVAIGVRTRPQTARDRTDVYQFRVIDVAASEILRTLDRQVNADTEVWFRLGELWQEDNEPSAATPWTADLLAELATGGAYSIHIGVGGGDGIKISRVRMVVATCDETRAGIGVLNQTSWVITDDQLGDEEAIWSASVPLRNADDTGGWAKADDTTYRLFFRRAFTGSDENRLAVTLPVVARHDSGQPAADTFMDHPLLLRAGSVSGPASASVPTAIAVAPAITTTRIRAPFGGALEPVGILPFRLLVGGVDSVDGQTYGRVMPLEVSEASLPIRQFVTTGAGGTYSVVRVAVGYKSAPPAEDLIVTVMDAAGVTTIGEGVISSAAYEAGPRFIGPRALLETAVDIEAELDPATQYQVVVSSDASEEFPWLVGVFTSRGGDGQEADWPDGAATYGGDTDYAFGHEAISAVELCDDLVGVLGLAVDGPDALEATPDALAFPEAAQPCGIEEIPYAVLGWAPSALGDDFALYRLQRRDDIDAEWCDIAIITNEDLDAFGDVEARIGMESEWRIRSEGPLGQTSLWTDVAAATLATIGCGFTFTANPLPLDAVAYVDVYETAAIRDFPFPGASEVMVRRFAGRDEFVVFRPTERRSERFTRRLLVKAFSNVAGIAGPRAFDALRELTENPLLPYVCVRDEQGNRWFAGVIVTGGRVRQPGGFHWVDADVIPVAVIPAAPTITDAVLV